MTLDTNSCVVHQMCSFAAVTDAATFMHRCRRLFAYVLESIEAQCQQFREALLGADEFHLQLGRELLSPSRRYGPEENAQIVVPSCDYLLDVWMVMRMMSRLGDIPRMELNFVYAEENESLMSKCSIGDEMVTNLKRYLFEHGIKQEWLAKRTGIPSNTISRIVNGQTPTLKNAQKIAKVLNTTIDELWPLEEEWE